MEAKETKTYTIVLNPEKLRDILIKGGLGIPKEGPFNFSLNNGHLSFTWSIDGSVTIKENA